MRNAPKGREYFFRRYLAKASVALSLWRSFECEKFAGMELGSPVLDLGCGDGFFARTVFTKPLDVGLDADPGEAARAAKSGAYRKVLCADATRLPFPSKRFRTVISNCVPEHIPDIQRALDEASRVTKPGGRLAITVPSELFDTSSYFQGFLRSLGLKGLGDAYIRGLDRVFKHYHVDDLATWGKRLHKAGYRVESAEYFMPLPAFHTYERCLPFSLPSKINKLLFGRWVLLPRGWIQRLAPKILRKALRVEGGKGVGYFIVARKIR